ncbi:MAG: hypothetical protein KKG60_00980 [Nanoarchaeota archaeon]|nr:hypothetical protein [Nanoarchaeota archaeon]
MLEFFIIGLFSGLGMGLKYTGTYKNTKVARVLFRIPINKSEVLHLHHWSLSLLMIIIIFLLIEAGFISNQNPMALLFLGYFIAFGVQGAFLQDAWKFIEKKGQSN